MRERFWEHYALAELTQEEWEALCDGCGRCCMIKLEDEDTDELYFTDVVCRYLDTHTGRCTSYANRFEVVPDCIEITADETKTRYDWLPSTCAYRRVSRGEGLADWHPLISGRRTSVIDAGISVRGKVISEALVPEDALQEHIVHWVE